MAFGCIIPPPFGDVQFVTSLNTTSSGTPITGGGNQNSTILTKILPAAMSAGGTSTRITFYGPASGFVGLNAIWIGQAASSGNAYNFDGGQAQVNFGGSAALNMSAGGVYLSDTISFAITLTRAIIVAFNVNPTPTTAGTNNLQRRTGLGSNFTTYEAFSIQEAGTTLKAGSYTATSGVSYPPFLIEVA